MLSSIMNFFKAPIFPDDENKTRTARNTNAVILFLLAIIAPFQILYSIEAQKNGVEILSFAPLVLSFLVISAWIFLKLERVALAGSTLVGVLWLTINGLAATQYGIKDSTFIANIPVCLLASFLLGWRAGAILSTLTIFSAFGLAWLESSGILKPPTGYSVTNFAVDMTGLLIISAGLTYLLVSNLQESLSRANATALSLQNINAELSAAQRTLQNRSDQLAAVNDVSSAASAILDVNELIEKVATLITEHFGYYYAAIFIVSTDAQWAELRNATGEAGRVLKESHHRLEVGGQSMVGSAIALRQPRIALDVGEESVRFNNPLLPYTRSEIALPLIIGENVLGALDVQSTRQNEFGPEEIETLQNMAKQLTIALENARLYQETNQRLREIQTVQRQYLRESWSLASSTQSLEYGLGEDAGASLHSSLNVPLTLRNEIIGQIMLGGDADWSAEEKTWVDSVATQAAIALENARLLETSKKIATADKIIAEISGKIWSSSTLDGILQTAVTELGKTFNAAEVILTLDPEDDGGAQ